MSSKMDVDDSVKTRGQGRWFFIVGTMAVLVIIGLTVGVTVFAIIARDQKAELDEYQERERRRPDICLTQDCVQVASRLGSFMDMKADPCEDFHQYACGRWPELNPIPDEYSRYTTFSVLDSEVTTKLRVLLSRPANGTAVQKAQTLYNTCLNLDVISHNGTAPLMEALEAVGRWPVLGRWTANTIDLEWLLAEVRIRGSSPILSWSVSADIKDSETNILYLDQPSLGLSRTYLVEAKYANYVAAYRKYATDIAVLLGADPTTAQTDSAAMVDFEIQLANLTMPPEERRDYDKLYNRMTLADLSSNISSRFDLKRNVNKIFWTLADMQLEDDEPVVVWSSAYVGDVLELVARTPVRTVTNYVVWRLVQGLVPYMGEEFLRVRQNYNKVLSGTTSTQPRWKTCVGFALGNMPLAVGRLFVDNYFQGSSKEIALDMIERVLAVTKDTLSTVPWMDEITRSVAVEKANAIEEKIGYPNYILNDTYLEETYRLLTPKRNQHLQNVMNIRTFYARESLRDLREEVDKTRWFMTAADVNAYYSSTYNQIVFPAGILQPPFYHKDYPKSLNFGGIGMVIGHEITHGFDDRGRQFDKEGNVKQWWSDDSVKNFKEKAKCIIDQYSNYTEPETGLNLNGIQTQGENIADNGGLKHAFLAYRHYIEEVRKGKEEPLLPGVPLNHNQLFFLNFAQIWCSTLRTQAMQRQILSRVHSPPKYRILGTLSNSPEFSEAFNCPTNTPMNPQKKCEVW